MVTTAGKFAVTTFSLILSCFTNFFFSSFVFFFFVKPLSCTLGLLNLAITLCCYSPSKIRKTHLQNTTRPNTGTITTDVTITRIIYPLLTYLLTYLLA